MIQAWRIIKAKYAAAAFDGEGARLYGGRWSSPGTRVVYVAQSLSLATLEMLVHLQDTPILSEYVTFSVDIPDECVESFPVGDLPRNWRDYPSPAANQAIGDRWVREARSLALRLPSAVIVQEVNYLLNPSHGDFHHLAASGPLKFDVDPRVMKR